MTFGETLKRLRQRNNISQDELAKKLNVKQYVISSWEIGRSEPNIEQIKFLSTYFNNSIVSLIIFTILFLSFSLNSSNNLMTSLISSSLTSCLK